MNSVIVLAVPGLTLPVAESTELPTLRWMPAVKFVILADSVFGSPSVAASAELEFLAISVVALTFTSPWLVVTSPPRVAVVSVVEVVTATDMPSPLPPALDATAPAEISALVVASTVTEPAVVVVSSPTRAVVVALFDARTKVASMGLFFELTVAVTLSSVSVSASTSVAPPLSSLVLPCTLVSEMAVDSPHATEKTTSPANVGLAAEVAEEDSESLSVAFSSVAPLTVTRAVDSDSATSGMPE